MEFGDLTTMIAIGLAIFIFIRLRAVLGQRTGHQGPGPSAFSRETPRRQKTKNSSSNDNVIPLPHRDDEQAVSTSAQTKTNPLDKFAKPGSALHHSLEEIIQSDPQFDPAQFIEGSKMAYEMIVTAFADGDKKTLKNLLSREVYQGFVSVIEEREKAGHVVKSSFVGVESADLYDASIQNNDVQVTVRFVSQIISATFDKNDNLIEGDEEQIVEVKDIWTFARNIRSRDPNWKLVATESE